MSVQARTTGTGDHAVVCLNGWFGHSGGWGPWERHLDTDSFTWVFPDYRGYGGRRDAPGDFTVDEISADMCALLEELPCPRVSLLGHSMGGVFMQRVLADTTRSIESLVGVSPVGAAGTPMGGEQRALFEAAESDTGARRTIIDITTGNSLPQRFARAVAEDSRVTSVDAAVGGYFRAWADADFLGELGTRDIPVKVFVGDRDPAVTEDAVRASFGVTYPRLEIDVLPEVGHYAMDEMPLNVAAKVGRFLGRPTI